MVKLTSHGIFLKNGRIISDSSDTAPAPDPQQARKNTIAYGILSAHNTSGNMSKLKIKFDAMASHDITYVGIIQTAKASGLKHFPMPYVLTNCHNSLCAVGGTINEDDHVFGLSAAHRYGGIYVPAHQAVIHSFMREMMSGCGKMILGSDSHTRYGALGTMAVGEGGPELVKQLLGQTYDISAPEVICVYLTGKPKNGVGPQDVALAIISAVFANGFVKNKVMEFVGDGIANLPIEYRNGIDVMTTETTCLTSIWETDDVTEAYFRTHKRPEEYKRLYPNETAYYDGLIEVNLSEIESMIALPYHPSNAVPIRELLEKPELLGEFRDKAASDGRIKVDQGIVAGCAGGTFDNLCAAADILRGKSIGSSDFAMSVYPASQPVFTALLRNGAMADLANAGVTIRSAFCGPCFGAGDVPSNGGLSIRHSTRNFPNREGSKPSDGQKAAVALMDARSIAATAMNGGYLTAADTLGIEYTEPEYTFDDTPYKSRVYNGFGRPEPDTPLKYGPNITDWPEMPALAETLKLKVASVILDPVTTTDELIPSGESSSYRSNPLKLAQLTLSRKDPAYVGRTKAAGKEGLGTIIYAVKPGDGSAREQAASCQKVLGTMANIAKEYATKRYRSNLINWGMVPFTFGESELPFGVDDIITIPNIRTAIINGDKTISACADRADGSRTEFILGLPELTDEEREILLAGCLINKNKID